jgi:hypothetical protein
VIDFALVEGDGRLSRAIADAALTRLGVDTLGLDAADRRYLALIAENYGGGPVGIETIAAALAEPRDALEEVIEPFLLQQGLIARTPRGRMLARKGWEHLGLPEPTPDGLVASPDFGHCVAEPLDVRVMPGRIEIDMSHPDVTIARQTFTFDGATLNSANASVPVTAPPAGPGADVLRWLGRHPFGVFDDMSERARFATIMPAGEISALANHVQVANSTFQQGDWVIGLGCLPQLCDSSRGVWGLRISDGAAGAAILGPNGAGTLYGLAATDPTLRQVIDAHRPR